MSSPVMLHSQLAPTHASSPTISTALLLRTPISPAEGTDAYHDAFGTFCLPSFPMSALDSGATTPVAAGFGFGMTVGGRVGGSEGEAQKERMRMSGTGARSSRGDGTAPPRPEEQLLQALQRQQLSINTNGRDKRTSSPHRNYNRTLPSYDDSGPSSPSSPSAPKKELPPSSPQEPPRKMSFVLTTHHATSSSAAASTAQEQREWCVTSMQVLSSQSANHDSFDQMLIEGQWAGVVATSTRAWDNWKAAVKRCKAKGKAPATNWQQTPFFLISPRAAATFRSTTLEGLPSEWTPSATKAFGCPANAKNQGADAEGKGAGEALGQYIVGWLQRRAAPAPTPPGEQAPAAARPPLLLLQGDKSLPALPDILTKNDIPFETIRVYETCEDPSLEDNLNRLQLFYTGLGIHDDEEEATLLLNSAEDESVELSAPSGGARPEWIVFFSPSGVDYSARHLRALGWLPPAPSTEQETDARDVQSGSAMVEYPRYVALGPTTAKHLRDQYGLYTEADLADANGGSSAPVSAVSAPQEEATVSESNGKDSGDEISAAKPAPNGGPVQGRASVFIATSTDPKGVREAIKQGERATA